MRVGRYRAGRDRAGRDRTGRSGAGRRAQSGFTYLWLLAAIAVLGVAMAAIGPVWAVQAQREREADLIRVGVAYAKAIEHYYAVSPGRAALPRRIDDLVQDPRFPSSVHHLRAAYGDPMNPGQPMQPVFDETGALVGVRSASPDPPLRQIAWTDGRHTVASAAHYSDWQFLAQVTR